MPKNNTHKNIKCCKRRLLSWHRTHQTFCTGLFRSPTTMIRYPSPLCCRKHWHVFHFKCYTTWAKWWWKWAYLPRMSADQQCWSFDKLRQHIWLNILQPNTINCIIPSLNGIAVVWKRIWSHGLQNIACKWGSPTIGYPHCTWSAVQTLFCTIIQAIKHAPDGFMPKYPKL